MLHTLLLVPLLLTRLDSPDTDRAEALAKDALQRSTDVRAAAPLIRLHALMDEVEDLNLLAEPYAALIYRRGTDERVRDLARFFYADLERARGRTTKGQEHTQELGFLNDWWLVGGFDNEGKGGCDTDFGPEAGLDLRATYPAKGREVGWRRLGAKPVDGYVDLSVSLKPSTQSVAYALTFLQADADTKVVLGLGTSGGYRLFVNNVKVSSSDRYNQPAFDQHRVQVSLRKGINRVLLKVCQDSGRFGFYARAERAEGARGAFRPFVSDTVPPLERGSTPQGVSLPTLAEAMATRVKAAPTDAQLRADFATVLAWTNAFPESEHIAMLELDKAAEAAPDDVDLQLRAAMMQDDANRRRLLLERAVKLDPKHPQAALMLGEHELSHEHPDLALKAATQLLSSSPNFGRAQLLRVHALEALGERVAAHNALEAAFSSLAKLPNVAREAVADARREERFEDAIARARMAVALRFVDTGSRRGLASMFADLGRVNEAVEQLEKVLVADPFDVGTALRLAELEAANDRFTDAQRWFGYARTLAPDDAEVHERLGKALLHAQKKDDALLAFNEALRLRPQNPALKEMVRTLRGDDTQGAAPHALTIAPGEKFETTGEDAVLLADVSSTRVQTSGLSSRFTQLAVKVLTDRGVEAFRQMPVTYSPDRQEVRVLKARITKPDGSVVDSYADQDRNINEPWTGMYYDARARVLSFPALSPGDVLELQWRVDDTAADNLLSDYWGDVDAVQGLYRKREYRFIVDMPKERTLQWNQATLPAWVKVTQEAQGDRVLYRFSATNVAKVIPEPQMPGWSEVATPLHVSTYSKWNDVGRYYWGLVRDQLVPNEELKKTVETVLKGVDRKDDAKVVAALYGFVVTNTRYVALEFGIHGYKPYRVDRVLARKFGDCKDKASLIVAMLKVAGIDARLVLLRMRHLGVLPAEPASLSAFNHAIAYVPKLGLYLDGTAEFYGSKELPSADRVANVLIVNPDSDSVFQTTPEADPKENASTLSIDVTMKTDGSAVLKGSLTGTGQAAPDLRRTYQTQATRVATFEQSFAQSFPGISASTVSLTDPKLLEAPSVLTFDALAPRYAEVGPGTLRFFPFGAGRSFMTALAQLTERKFDLQLGGVWLNTFHFSYTLPAGWAAVELPGEVVERSAFGEVRIVAKKVDAKLVIDGEMTLKQARIAPAEYGAFREWLAKVDQAFSKKLSVQQVGGRTVMR